MERCSPLEHVSECEQYCPIQPRNHLTQELIPKHKRLGFFVFVFVFWMFSGKIESVAGDFVLFKNVQNHA